MNKLYKLKTRFAFAFVFLLLAFTGLKAQTNLANYRFAKSTSTYTPIVGGTVVASGAYDNQVSALVPLGGTFNYGGTAFTGCYISANGYITFGAAPSTTNYTPLSTLGTTTGAISAFGQDAGGSTVAGATPEVSYLNIGGASGEFVVQYQDHANYYNRSQERLNFQIRLNLADGSINIVYGNCTAPGTVSTTGTTPQVGIRGNSVTWASNVNNLMVGNVPTSTTCNWSNAVTGNANTSTMLFSGTTNVNVNIPNGLTYTWIPQTTLAPVRTFAAVSAITSDGATLNWTAPTGATQYNVYYRTVGSCGWTAFAGNPVMTNTAVLTGLASSTTYQISVESSDGVNNSIYSHIPNQAGTGNGYVTAGTFTTLVPNCSGTPVAGNITGVSSVCSGSGTTLTLNGATSDVGISYQWASSTVSGGPYNNLGTSLTQATGTLTSTTYFVVTVTCSFGGSSMTSEYTLNVNALPSVSVTPTSANYCNPGSAVGLTASGTATSYAWLPASGLSATTGTNVNASPGTTTTYTVTGTDGNGCTNTATTAITVAEVPSLSSVTATPNSICSGANSQLNAVAGTTTSYLVQSTPYNFETPSGAPTTIFTSGDDAVSSSINLPFSFNYFGVGYTNIFAYTNGFIQLGTNSSSTGSYGATIPTAGAPNNIIAGVWDDLNVTGTGTPTVRYFTNGVAPNRTFIVEYSAVKFYNSASNNGNVTFQIKLFENGKIEIHLNNVVDPSPSSHYVGIENSTGTVGYAPAARNPFSTDITTSEAWVFTPNGGTVSYVWSPATFLSSTTIANPVVTAATTTTTYTVTATAGACSSTGSVTVNVGSPLSSNATVTPGASVCAGTNITLNSTATGGGAPYTYDWVGPNSFTSNVQNPVISGVAVAATGTYTVTITDNCGVSTVSTVSLTVNALPSVTATPSSGLYCNPGTAVAITASGTATGYAWLPAAGLSATTGANVNASPSTTTTYTVTGTDGNGCSNTATTIITSSPAVSMASVLASPATICSGANSTITASASLILPAYCTAGATSTSFEKISNITFGTINNTSSATAGYENFVAQSTNVTAGVSTPISIGISSAYANDDRIHIWVDMDNDGVFADPAENVLNLAVSTFCPACSGTNTTITGNITIPTTAFNGSTRMRIRLEDQSSGGNLTPCGTSTYGQVEDYTVNISGGTANPALTYAWTPSTFLSSTSVANPTATAMTTTTTYSVTATSAAGCSAQGNVTVTVNALPTVTASSDDADNTVCENTMVTLTGGGATSYTWDNSVSDGVAFTPAATTTYNVTGTDGNGCSNTANITITVNTLPTVTASSDDADNTVCENTMVTLTGGGATSYTWDNGVSDAVAFAATTTTTYNVTGTDGNGCSNTANITLTVNTLPTVTASSDDADNTVCENTMVTLTGGGATSYTWDNGVSDAVAFAATTTTTYNVTGTDGNGCSNTANITLTVNALPTVTASSDDADNAICENTMVTLTGGGATSYTWDNSVSDGVAFTPASTTTYNVTGTDGNGCSNTANITITVNTLPTVTASSDDADNAICEGLMVTLNGGGADTYTWDNGVMDGASFAPTATTLYTVTGTDLNGCSNTATITITVNPLPVVDLAPFTSPVCDNGGMVSLVDGTPTGGVFSGLGVSGNTFDPSAVTPGMIAITYSVTDGNGCIGSDVENIQVDLCTGIASNDSQFINLYPNPTTGVFTVVINNANSNQVVITIVDMQGKVVFNESDKNVSAQYNKQIDLTELAKGIYYVKMNIGTDVKIEKLIVQ